MKLIISTFLIAISLMGNLHAGLWPSGHFRLGAGVQSLPESEGIDMDMLKVGQISFDIQPFVVPVYISLDIQGSLESDGDYNIGADRGSLTSKVQQYTLGARLYKDIGPIDIYGGIGLNYLKSQQKLEGVALLKEISDEGLGVTFIVGFTDLKVFLPAVGWGVEFRYARVNVDSFTDVDARKGSWLLTCGIGW
ncbi:MAG: outer membrane beta-barrel protein [Planctomycetes bacterium]|nr:outer membrane beta-barrel protein [Planctomycetota bacterium]